MKTLKILKGWHRPINGRWLPSIYQSQPMMGGEYMFAPSCRYHLAGDDQFDINKLFGLSYSFSPHTNSNRVGWRYNAHADKIELFQYSYTKGVRSFSPLCEVGIGQRVKIQMMKDTETSVTFRVFGLCDKTISGLVFKMGFSVLLGLYFGGNSAAPHDIEVVEF